MKYLIILFLFWSSFATAFTGKWQEHLNNDTLDRIIKSQFHYVNDKKIRFLSSRNGEVRAIGIRPRPLKPHQIEGMKKAFAIVPLEPLSAIEEIEGGYKIYYGNEERVLLLADYLPVQYADKPDTPPVVMTEVGDNTLVVETIYNSGDTVLEVYSLTANDEGKLTLNVVITVNLIRFITPLVVERKYVPWSSEPEKSYVK